MGKAKLARKSSGKGKPYDPSVARVKPANNIFKLNKDIGQHILKNPGIAQAIVEKASLKQSDVRSPCLVSVHLVTGVRLF